MMIDHIVAPFWPEHDRNQVGSEEAVLFLAFARAPLFAALFHFAQANGHLGRPEIGKRYGFEDGFAYDRHRLNSSGTNQNHVSKKYHPRNCRAHGGSLGRPGYRA